MSSVRARVWRFTVEKGKAGAEAVQAVEIGQGPLPVSLAAVVNINALACDLRKTVDQRVRDHEISLLLSYIAGSPGAGSLGVDCPALDSSSGHIRRFVSECTGLGVMTAASEALFDWKPGANGLSSFDVLPGKLVGTYAKKGVRPDLLYDLATGPLAGEARGRRRDHKQMFPAGKGTQAQKARLEKLAQWSVDHGDHAYFMSWVWLGTGGIYVDIFLPDDAPATAGLKTGWIDMPGSGQPWRFRVPRPDPRRREDLEPEGSLGVRADSAPSDVEGSADVTGAYVRTAIRRAEPVVEAAMNRSFSREDTLGTFSGVEVRGRWIRGDAVGQARHEVLLGVLEERVPVDHRAQRRQLASRTDDRLDVFLEGRLLTIVHPVDSPRPSWDRVQSELLG
ncbi:hypothetical protein ACFCXS_24260 [Streptomyces sp. NPDC056373]|uniref:hypothetical protein n=1 Tax=Streptomyces sp. NPDC056373 TaxID=3345798 RepID=UPI0035E22725